MAGESSELPGQTLLEEPALAVAAAGLAAVEVRVVAGVLVVQAVLQGSGSACGMAALNVAGACAEGGLGCLAAGNARRHAQEAHNMLNRVALLTSVQVVFRHAAPATSILVATAAKQRGALCSAGQRARRPDQPPLQQQPGPAAGLGCQVCLCIRLAECPAGWLLWRGGWVDEALWV